MRITWLTSSIVVLVWILLGPRDVTAQPLGTFRWQLQPFCNVLALSVVQNGANYTLDGVDDLCGGATRGAVVGLGFPKPDGTIGFGLTIVTGPGAEPVHVTASLSLSTVSGTWVDNAGNAGAFVFNPAIAPGSPRPLARPVFVAGLSAGGSTVANVASPLAATDAANRLYVDAAVLSGPREGWINVNSGATIRSTSPNLAGTTVQRPAGNPTGVYCLRFPTGHGFQSEAAVGSVQQQFGGDGVVSFITVTRTIGNACNLVGFDISVQTYSSTGVPADRAFMVVVPR